MEFKDQGISSVKVSSTSLFLACYVPLSLLRSFNGEMCATDSRCLTKMRNATDREMTSRKVPGFVEFGGRCPLCSRFSESRVRFRPRFEQSDLERGSSESIRNVNQSPRGKYLARYFKLTMNFLRRSSIYLTGQVKIKEIL